MIAERSFQWSLLTGVLLLAHTTADVRQSKGPIIIKPTGKEIILQSGQNYTIECVGNRPIQIKQQDVPEESTGNFYMEDRLEVSDNESEYKAVLDLYNVDQFAVGFYACFDDNATAVLSDLTEEPSDTEHVSYIYIYVNGSTLFAPMRTFVLVNKKKFVIECKPTTPDIKVTLSPQSNKRTSVNFTPKIGFIFTSTPIDRYYICELLRGNESAPIHIRSNVIAQVPKPIIYGSPYFMEGETFTLSCSVSVTTNIPLQLMWKIPKNSTDKVEITSNANNVTNGLLFSNITVKMATREFVGTYICEAMTNGNVNNSERRMICLDEPKLEVKRRVPQGEILVRARVHRIKITFDAHPPPKVEVFKDGDPLPVTPKYKRDLKSDSFMFEIRDMKPSDSGKYTLRVYNGQEAQEDFEIRKEGPPSVDFGSEADKKYLKGVMVSLKCEADAFPLPNISWSFFNGDQSALLDKKYQTDTTKSVYKVISILNIQAKNSGYITCTAANNLGSDNATRRLLIQDMPGGFGIKNAENMWFPEGENVVLRCYASRYDYVNVTWYDDNLDEMENVQYIEGEDSLIANLIIANIKLEQARPYTCAATNLDGRQENQTVPVSVSRKQEPEVWDPVDRTLEVVPYQPVNMTCVASAVPPPTIEWYKDEVKLNNTNDTQIDTYNLNQTLLNSTVTIRQMKKELVGTYECRVTSEEVVNIKTFKLVQNEPHTAIYLTIAGVIFAILILVVVYLIWKIRREKQKRKEMAAAGLLYFKEGVTKSINPALGIDEQAELLPYDEKFEFPAEKLTLGKQLGAGAFGVVYKAEARGIINAEETTTVAVKMVKKTADNMYIKALASELKIMVHLGKHINIVNLLGACTKNVGKRELIVIVEYCKFGNIHNYLLKHREVFIDQFNDNSEKTMGRVNRGFSSSSGNSGSHSDYFGSNHTQNTDNTFLNSANTNRSCRKVSETGYIQPEWRSNYESDYSFDGRSPRPLCSRDLLAWAFQIARGMEYLASRKVLHGDLAARNILLAEDNVVKICDFGLARSIYKNDEYQKKENSPLPVKWLAIECMTDRIFSTQSDVWSFGIVLWELFSLAKTPYPNISPPNLLNWLSEGRRLEKPAHSDDRIYDVMRKCWAAKPTQRPTFTQLQELLGSYLEDNVRNHYVDLNAEYMSMNLKKPGEEDYLAMVCAPEYNNIVTPSPHNYANQMNFFPPTPTQLQHDAEGYLQMSPANRQTSFNARAQGTKFDFDVRKSTPRVSEANSYGSESTPMLTLNNLPRSGSESDQETENASPYLNVCPRIEEETDDVFGTKENNAKNIQPDGVTNLTYITLSVDDEKKPHNYINVNVPNGLVK